MTTVPAPLFISARLMAAYKIPDVGTLHLHADGRNGEGRLVYTYVIEDADGTELETNSDLSSGVGSDVDYLAMMETLLSFLEAAAERGLDSTDGDPDLFGTRVTEWAMQYSDELGYARMEIDQNPGNHPDDCARCLRGDVEPHLVTIA